MSLRGGVGRAIAIALLLACGSDDASPKPSITPNTEGWWRGDVFYEVFVRSFADSDGDGVGDLPGLTARLDVLNDGDPATRDDLGVDGIWLMPIFPSPSYHGYDVTDYRAVQPAYGTLADLDALVAAAHARGIRVVLDMVLNHSSSQHPWFVDARSGPSAAHRDWYRWSDTNPGWTKPWDGTAAWYSANGSWYYGIFSPAMPDLNVENAAVEAELVDAMKFWLARGIDGFRLDAVRYLVELERRRVADQPESHAFLKRVRAALQRDYPDALLVAEAWANTETQASYYGDGDEVQLAFSFDLADAIRASVRSGDASAAINAFARLENALKDRDPGFSAPFLSNHDQVRTMRQLEGDEGGARLAAAILLALPGTPFLYYGEELGMMGGAASNDEWKRTPYRWTSEAPGYGFTEGTSTWYAVPAEAEGTDLASQRNDPASLWSLYRDLVALRHAEPALAEGAAARPSLTGAGPGVFALVREAPEGRVLFLANLATADQGAFEVAVDGAPGTLLAGGDVGAITAAGAALEVEGLGARSFAYVSLD